MILSLPYQCAYVDSNTDMLSLLTLQIMRNDYCQLVSCPEVIKHFSSSARLSMKIQLLINVENFKNFGKFRFKTQKLVIILLLNVKMPTIVVS